MLRYIAARLLLLLPILLLVSVAVFGVLRLGKTDPAQAYLRVSGIPHTENALAQAREHLGLDQPLPAQYARWLAQAAQGDFGRSYVNGHSALGEILHYLPVTATLTLLSMLATIAAGLPLGMLAAVYKDRWPDHLTRLFAFTGVSMPSFWLGFLCMYLFALKLQWLPALGLSGPLSYVLPVFTLSFMSTGITVRLVRASILEHMHERSVLYARARGLRRWRILGQHVLKNALIPVVTSLGMHFGELLGGAVIVENIFNIPGVGRYVITAIYNHDYPVIQAFTLMTTTFFILLNLSMDVLYAWIDPRIRLGRPS